MRGQTVLVVLHFLYSVCRGFNHNCGGMKPQHVVDIDQLYGIWYGIEKIYHLDTRHYTEQVPSCPIIYISEERYAPTTYNPLYNSYTGRYGQGYPYYPPYGNRMDPRGRTREDYEREMRERDRDRMTTYPNHPSRQHHTNYLMQKFYETKYLKVMWEENGSTTEYHLRYNATEPGFWISSGPNNGSSLDTKYSRLAGVFLVMKAVGNHLVLTICHTLPDKQLFTILLSRETSLNNVEVHGVHTYLTRQGLDTHAIHKVCNSASGVVLGYLVLMFAVVRYYLL